MNENDLSKRLTNSDLYDMDAGELREHLALYWDANAGCIAYGMDIAYDDLDAYAQGVVDRIANQLGSPRYTDAVLAGLVEDLPAL